MTAQLNLISCGTTAHSQTLTAIVLKDKQMNPRISILLVGLMLSACMVDKKADTISKDTVDTAINKTPGVDDKEKGTDRVVEKIKVNSDMFTEIILTADNLVDEIEYASFDKMMIKNGEKIIFELYDQDAYDTMESKAIKVKNEVNSKNLLLQRVKDKYFISLFGAQYGCCPRTMTIVQVDKNGVSKIFKDAFELHEVIKSDNGEIKYLGIDSFSESIGAVDSLDIELFTYNPTLVYSLSDSFKFDSLGTKQYNEENYVFAGYDYQGELRVAFPRDGRERKKGTKKPYIYRD